MDYLSLFRDIRLYALQKGAKKATAFLEVGEGGQAKITVYADDISILLMIGDVAPTDFELFKMELCNKFLVHWEKYHGN